MENYGGFLRVQRVEPLHDVGEFDVLLERGLLAVVVVALGAAHGRRVLRPGLRYAAMAEVVLARQLNGLVEYVEANGTQKFFLEAVFPVLIHDAVFDSKG